MNVNDNELVRVFPTWDNNIGGNPIKTGYVVLGVFSGNYYYRDMSEASCFLWLENNLLCIDSERNIKLSIDSRELVGYSADILTNID